MTHPAHPDEKLRILLMAPVKAVGGIATWARFLMRNSDSACTEYRTIDTSKLYDPLGRPLGLRGAILGTRDGVMRLFEIAHALISFRPHIVWFTCSPSIGPAVRDVPAIALLRMLGVPSIAHFHGGNVPGFYGGNPVFRTLRRLGWALCRAQFVITREVEQVGRDLYPDDKIIYVPNMVSDELWDAEGHREKVIRPAAGDKPLKIIHVAWQSVLKGTEDLINAMPYVTANVECDLVGGVPNESQARYEARIRELGVEGKIRLCGRRDGEDLANTYRQADIFCLPTHREGPEGFPMTVLEAMTYGVPILANEVGNIRDMIGVDTDRPAGMLLEQVDPIDPKELAAKLDALAADAELRQRMSDNGRYRVETHYLGPKIVPELEDLIADLAWGTPGQRRLHRWGRVRDGRVVEDDA